MTDIEVLSNRLRTLEGRFQRIKVLGALACILAMALVTMGQVSPKGGLQRVETQVIQEASTQTEIRAQHFVLVDDTGKERASLTADAAGSVFLVMFDGAGKYRANLSVTSAGPNLVFYDPGGQARNVLGSTTLVGSHINGERSPASSIVLFDKDGKLLYRVP